MRARRLSLIPGKAHNVVFTRHEVGVLLAIKSGFAFVWGFINAVTISQSGRFATIMTGNLLLLAFQTKAWEGEEIVLTVVLILAYILGGALYDALSIVVKEETKILRYALSTVVFMAILADVLHYVMENCQDNQDETEGVCKGRYLYYMAPVSFVTGIVASGYCTAHPDGFIVTLMTNHMRVCPNSLLKMYLPDGDDGLVASGPERTLLVEKACTSAVLISMSFLGVVAGDYAGVIITEQHSQGKFSPVFTVIGIFLVCACVLHSAFYNKFMNKDRTDQDEQMEDASN